MFWLARFDFHGSTFYGEVWMNRTRRHLPAGASTPERIARLQSFLTKVKIYFVEIASTVLFLAWIVSHFMKELRGLFQ